MRAILHDIGSTFGMLTNGLLKGLVLIDGGDKEMAHP